MPQNSRIYFIWAGKPSFFHISKFGQILRSVSLCLCTSSYPMICFCISKLVKELECETLLLCRSLELSTFQPHFSSENCRDNQSLGMSSFHYFYKQKSEGFQLCLFKEKDESTELKRTNQYEINEKSASPVIQATFTQGHILEML